MRSRAVVVFQEATLDHGRFEYSAIARRPKWELPHGARVAVWITPNVEHFHYDKPAMSMTPMTAGLRPDVLNYAWRDYGARVGDLAADGNPRPAGFCGNRGAQFRSLSPLSGDHRGGQQAPLGVDGAWPKQFVTPHRHAGGEPNAASSRMCSTRLRAARATSRAAGSDRLSPRPTTPSTFWLKPASTMSPTGATTSSPTR